MRFNIQINFDEFLTFSFKFTFSISITFDSIFFICSISLFIKSTITFLTFFIRFIFWFRLLMIWVLSFETSSIHHRSAFRATSHRIDSMLWKLKMLSSLRLFLINDINYLVSSLLCQVFSSILLFKSRSFFLFSFFWSTKARFILFSHCFLQFFFSFFLFRQLFKSLSHFLFITTTFRLKIKFFSFCRFIFLLFFVFVTQCFIRRLLTDVSIEKIFISNQFHRFFGGGTNNTPPLANTTPP